MQRYTKILIKTNIFNQLMLIINKNIKYIINMSRTKGALNKSKGNVSIISLNKQIPNSPEINDKSSYNWVTWGKDNLQPMHLLNLYYNSITHRACVDFIVQAIIGEGVRDLEDTAPNLEDTWEEFFTKIVTDYYLFGGYAFQIIKNKDGKTYTFVHQQIATVRVAKKDEQGVIKKAYLCNDWSQTAIYRPIEIDMYNFTDDEKIASGKPYLFVFYDYNVFDNYYSTPRYISGIKAIKADIEMNNYDYNSTLNSFVPSGIVTLNQIGDEEEKKAILKNLKNTFTGSDNASNLIVTFRNSNEDKPVEFQPIAANDGNINMFSDTNDRTKERIVAAHKIANKALIGLSMDSTGFSDEGSLLEASYNLMEKTAISHYRDKIVNIFNKMLQLNGIDSKIIIKPLSFNLNDVTSIEDINVTKDENVNIDKQNENNEEKIV